MQKFIRGVGSLVVLLALLVGAPMALIALIGNPWPPGGWSEVQLFTNRTLVGLIGVIAWLAWAQMTACVLVEAAAAVKTIRERGLAFLVARGTGARQVGFATGGQQHLARFLITSIAALGVGAGTVASAGAATPVHHAPQTTPHTTVATSTQHTDQHAGQVQQAVEQGPTATVAAHATLWKLAETHLGDGAQWRQLLDLNHGRALADGSLLTNATQTIPAGSVINLPAGAKTAPAEATTTSTSVATSAGPSAKDASTYTVEPGDNLWEISEHALGDGARYGEIFKASEPITQPGGARLTDPDHIEPGWTVTIPGGGMDDSDGHAATGPANRDTTPKPAPAPEQAPQYAQPGQDETKPDEAKPDEATPEESKQNEDGPSQHETPNADAPETPHTAPSAPAAPVAPVKPGAEHPGTGSAGERGDREVSPQTRPASSPTNDSSEQGGEETQVASPWVLPGLTGAGVLLAGALFMGLQSRRRAQFRSRRPGRGIVTPAAELAATERTIIASGTRTAMTVEFMDEALKRVAEAAYAAEEPMPALAAVELHEDTLTLHLSEPTTMSAPWQGSPDETHWHCTTDVDLDEIGPDPSNAEAPYPLLVTVGEGAHGEIWLLNCEELGTITVTGDAEKGRDFARHLAAQLAVNPWSRQVEIDCVGLAAEAEPLGERIRYHHAGAEGEEVTEDLLTNANTMIDRAAKRETDVSTGRTGQIDDDAWPARMLVLDAATGIPDKYNELARTVDEQRGRTATSIVVTGQAQQPGTEEAGGWEVCVTASGRIVLGRVGLELAAVGLTSEETRGCALLFAQSEIVEDVPVPVDEDAEDGWEAYADQAGALRREHTLPRSTREDDLDEPATSMLDLDDETYVRESAVELEDLERLAPKVPTRVRAKVEQTDPTLDDDVAAWFDPDSGRARLYLLGPVNAIAYGTALTRRKAYNVELLAFLALRRRHGVTVPEVADAFSITKSKAREYVRVLRDWLGTNPLTGQPYLPNADEAPAAKTRGVNVYQVDGDLLVDMDLFRRLRVRAEARGEDGLEDLVHALELVTGRPFTQLRPGGWDWLAEGDRHDMIMPLAIADVAFTVATAYLGTGDLARARAATELAMLVAPDEEATRLCLVALTEAEGDQREAERILRDEVCNRSDDDGAPPELNPRTKAIIEHKEWLAS